MVKLGLKNLAILPSNFDLFFWTPKTKSTSQARIKPDIFVNFRPEPDPKSPARLTTLVRGRQVAHKAEASHSFV